jgi:hypothetical protein
MHGFVGIEIADGFRLGGNLDAGFTAGLETILKDVRPRAAATRRSTEHTGKIEQQHGDAAE